jgi:hypothetical protein
MPGSITNNSRPPRPVAGEDISSRTRRGENDTPVGSSSASVSTSRQTPHGLRPRHERPTANSNVQSSTESSSYSPYDPPTVSASSVHSTYNPQVDGFQNFPTRFPASSGLHHVEYDQVSQSVEWGDENMRASSSSQSSLSTATYAIKPEDVQASGRIGPSGMADTRGLGSPQPFRHPVSVDTNAMDRRNRTANMLMEQAQAAEASGGPTTEARRQDAAGYAAEAVDKMFHPHPGRIPAIDTQRPHTAKWVRTGGDSDSE